MRTILVAIDESESSERVAAFVNGFFGGDDVELVGVNVGRVPMPMMPPVGWGMAYAWPAFAADASLPGEAAAAERRAETTVVDSSLRDAEAIGEVGDPVDAILAVAPDRDADLIVVGSNHKSTFQRLLSPSVSRELVKSADRPVLLVP